MKPQAADLEVRSTLQGDKIDMTFDENSLTHLMSVLTDLYSDPELAVIREYSTNAFDAHVEAGVSDPIEITLPTDLAPFFRVRDHGIGLSHDDIRDIYSKYGASSKRETDTQTGMLGLGCKSALTYSNQFSLVGVKDGRKVTVSISRNEEGAGSMTVVEDATTDEPNGVEVIVPAKRPNHFREKSAEFFRFWPEGSVTVNGAAPEGAGTDAIDIDDDLMLLAENDYDTNHVILMGNVPYPVPHHRLRGLEIDAYNWKLVARVPIGAVNFTPSREELQYTKRTEAVLTDLVRRFNAGLAAAINAKIEDAPTPWDALAARTTWRQALRGATHAKVGQSWKGHPIPPSYPSRTTDRDHWPITTDRHSHVKGRHHVGLLSAESIPGLVWVVGFDYAKFSHVHKRKLETYAAAQAAAGTPLPEFRSYALTREVPDIHWWIDPARVIDWTDVKSIKLPKRERTSTGRLPGAYDIYQANSHYAHEVDAADLDPDDQPTYYVAGQKWAASSMAEAILHFEPYAWIVWMQERREAKFTRNFPAVGRASDRVRALYASWRDGLSADVRLALKLKDVAAFEAYQALDPHRLRDPELVTLSKLANDTNGDLTKIRKVSNLFNGAIYGLTADLAEGNPGNPLAKYPLYDRYDLHHHPEHMYLYLNAAYAAEKGD